MNFGIGYHFPKMSALLRSGKFLRLVTSFAKQQQPLPGAPGQQQSNNHVTLPNPGQLGHHAPGMESQLANHWDASAPFQAWSLQHLQGALPTVAGAHQDDEEDASPEEDVLWPRNHVTKKEIESLLSKLPALDARLSLSQSMLVFAIDA